MLSWKTFPLTATSRPVLKRPAAAALVATVAAAALLAGCSDEDDSSRDADPAPSSVGAPDPGNDAAAFCDGLVADKTIAALEPALKNAVLGKPGAAQKLQAAAARLRKYGAAGLGENAGKAAADLEELAADPTSSSAANQFATAASALDHDMEEACDL